MSQPIIVRCYGRGGKRRWYAHLTESNGRHGGRDYAVGIAFVFGVALGLLLGVM